jgi:hypothetical protein
MFKEYAPMSPYAFSLDNPIIFRDKDGNVVVGGDGKEVTYKRSGDGLIEWSSNATADIQRIGNAMLSTTTGTEAYNYWQDLPNKVSLKLDTKSAPKSASGNPIYGENDARHDRKTGELKPGKFKVTIYLKNIQNDNKDGLYSQKIDDDEAIGAVGTHERWHLDPTQAKLDDVHTNPFTGICREDEEPPSQNLTSNSEVNFRSEYRANKGVKGDAWKSIYTNLGYNGLDENNKPKKSEEPKK